MLLGHRGLDLYGKTLSAAKTREGSGPFFNIFLLLVLLLVLNSSLLHRPFLCSTVRCYTYQYYYWDSSLLHRPFLFYNSSLLVYNSFAVTQTVLILQQFAVAQTVLIFTFSGCYFTQTVLFYFITVRCYWDFSYFTFFRSKLRDYSLL